MDARLPWWRFRSPQDAGLTGPESAVYKHDARSRVWRIDRPEGPVVVKRFEHHPWRQRLALMLGRHPAQLEHRANRRLCDRGIRVAPIVDYGIEKAGLGARAWLATRWVGASLQRRLVDRPDTGEAHRLIDAAAELTRDLLAAGLTFKDLKPSNMVIDVAGRAWLIDVGSVRADVSPRAVERMLGVMDRVLARDQAPRPWRQRFLEQVREPTGSDPAKILDSSN